MARTKGAKGKHHKEKPHKEKKQRGRPKGSIKQKQHQHQNVNVKVINNNGGGGGGGGKITIPIPFQLPSTVYDPSLVQPFYGINDRQPVNPLTDASTDLITPVIQSIISNQAANKPNIINKPNITDKTLPIKEKDVKPVNPVIPKPIEQPTLNPQTDQSHSHPIKPEDITIVSDLNLPSHNKHQQHKTIKDMIKPQVPKEVKPKYKDTEGLGMKIPVENIAGIATTVASGALGGGIIAGGEALLTGSGLAASLESAGAGAVGGGVATAVNNAIGGGYVGHVISGIAGGVAGRTAITRARTRTNNTEETIPLLNGNRLGGRSKTSRLVNDQEIQEIKQTHDPLTGETTQWRLPTEEQRTMFDKVKKAAKKTIENLNDTVQNLKQQITGRARKGGTYSRVPTEETINSTLNKFDEDAARQQEFDEFISKPQKANKEKQEAAKFLLSKIKLKKDEPGRKFLQKVVRENINKQNARQLEDVTQKQTKKILEDALHETNIEDNAVETLSKFIKGHADRKRYKYIKTEYPQIAAKRKKDVASMTPSLLLQKELKKPLPTNTKSLLEQELIASRERAHKLYEAAIAKHPKKILYDSMVKSGDIQNAAAARTRRINEKTIKARQLVNDVKVKQLEAVKNDAINNEAAIILQSSIRRQNAKKDKNIINLRMADAGDKIGKIKTEKATERIKANVKRLLTRKPDFHYNKEIKKAFILNKNVVGEPLAVSKNLKLVSKKKQKAAKEGYENRLAFLDMAEKYKDIMIKGKK